LTLSNFFLRCGGMRVNYVIAAYNNMANVQDASGDSVILLGLEAFIPPDATVASGHSVADFDFRRLESAAWYLIRRAAGKYDLRRIPGRPGDSTPMVATRSILASPFERDDTLYFAGYDANKAPAHNSSWIVRSAGAAAIGVSP
jgi:hypothetical protein